MAVGLNLYPLFLPCGAVTPLVTVVVAGWASFAVIDAVIRLYPPNDFLQRPPWSKVAFDVVIRHWCVHLYTQKMIKDQKKISPVISKTQSVFMVRSFPSQTWLFRGWLGNLQSQGRQTALLRANQ